VTTEQPKSINLPGETSLRSPSIPQNWQSSAMYPEATPPSDLHRSRVLELEAENRRLRHLVAELLASNQKIRDTQR
jgi:hypothetical protein